jgi:hypothetical protein
VSRPSAPSSRTTRCAWSDAGRCAIAAGCASDGIEAIAGGGLDEEVAAAAIPGGGIEAAFGVALPVIAASAAAMRSLGSSRIFVSRSSPSTSIGMRARVALMGGVEGLEALPPRSGMGGADARAPVLAVADEAPLPRAGVVRRVGGSRGVREGDEGGTNEGGRTLGGGAAPAPACPGSVGRAASGGGP